MSSLLPGVSFNYPPALTPGGGMDSARSMKGIAGAGSPDGPGLSDTYGFGDVLRTTLGHVNQLEGGAHQQVTSMLEGGGGDVSSVMIAVEKADVAFQLMMQVRNKIVNAYQDIEKMQF